MSRRPRIENKTAHVLVRITPTQRAELEGVAAALSLSIGGAVRMALTCGLTTLLPKASTR